MIEIQLNGPGKNCLSTSMMDSLIDRLAAANGAPVLLTGAGDAFCAGLDLRELASLDAAGLKAYLLKLEKMVEVVYRYPGPLVGAANGHAIAGGTVLLLCCDYRVCTRHPKVKLGLNELALGVTFPPVTLSIVMDRIPRQHHNAVILGGGLFDPVESLRLGLVDELAEDPVAVAKQRLAVFSHHPSGVYAATKGSLLRPRLEAAWVDAQFAQMFPAWSGGESRQRIEAALKPRLA